MARTANPFVSNLQHHQLGILSPMNFSRQTSGSIGLVKRLSLHNKLEHHEECVNTLHFNMSGDLLASGSDDPDIVIWDWAKGKKKIAYESGHLEGTFQVRFMPYTDTTIVSCGGDGKVHVGFLHPSSGEGCRSTKCLAQHNGAAYMLCIQPDSTHEFLTCGDDGAVFHVDLRDDKVNKLFYCCAEEHETVPLFTICANPRNIYEFAVGGDDQFARVYDRRKLPGDNQAFVQPVKKYSPHHLMVEGGVFVTGLGYSYNGTELLVSYDQENIYLFNVYSRSEAEYIKMYKGHRNNVTINFYGPQSEYVVSGSDCSHVFLWDKQTEEVVQFLQGDDVDICMEPHPHVPILATGGLDHNIKLWLPTAQQPTDLDGLINARNENGDTDSDSDLTDGEYDYNDLIDDLTDGEDDDNDLIDNLTDGEDDDNDLIDNLTDGEDDDNDLIDNLTDGEDDDNDLIDNLTDGEDDDNDLIDDLTDGEDDDNDLIDDLAHGEDDDNDLIDDLAHGEDDDNDLIDDLTDGEDDDNDLIDDLAHGEDDDNDLIDDLTDGEDDDNDLIDDLTDDEDENYDYEDGEFL